MSRLLTPLRGVAWSDLTKRLTEYSCRVGLARDMPPMPFQSLPPPPRTAQKMSGRGKASTMTLSTVTASSAVSETRRLPPFPSRPYDFGKGLHRGLPAPFVEPSTEPGRHGRRTKTDIPTRPSRLESMWGARAPPITLRQTRRLAFKATRTVPSTFLFDLVFQATDRIKQHSVRKRARSTAFRLFTNQRRLPRFTPGVPEEAHVAAKRRRLMQRGLSLLNTMHRKFGPG